MITPPQGIPARQMLEAHESKLLITEHDIEDLRRNAKTAADGYLDLSGQLGEMARDFHALSLRVDDLAADVRKAIRIASSPPDALTLPPMRDELPSVVALEQLRERTLEAVKDGIESPHKSPEEEVRRIFAAEEEKRELARLRKEADDARTALAKSKAERGAFWRRVAETIIGGLLLSGSIELARWVASFHH